MSIVHQFIDYFFDCCFIMIGFVLYATRVVFYYVDFRKCPVFIVWEKFMKTFLKMLLTRRSYVKEGYDDVAVERGDGYIDQLTLEIVQNRREEYEPYIIEDSVVGFHKKVIFVNVSGEAKLHSGYIKGLSSLHRSDHCSLHEDGERLLVKADLGAGVLDFHYSGSAKFMNFGPTITVEGELSYIEVHMEFTVDSKTGRNGSLVKFVIDDMKGMKVWVTGLGPINWAVNPIISAVTKIFKRFVRNFMENKVEKHIAEHITNFQFPVEGNVETEAPVTNKPETTVTEVPTTEPEDTNSPETTQEPETTSPPEPETTQEPETTSPPEPETTQEPETTGPPEPETTQEPETTSPPEPETTVSPETETDSPKEPESDMLEDNIQGKQEDTEGVSSSEAEGKFDLSSSNDRSDLETAEVGGATDETDVSEEID